MTPQRLITMDRILADLLRRARSDGDTVGLLITDGRAIRILDRPRSRRPVDGVTERITTANGRSLEVVDETMARLERRAARPDRHTSTYLAATVAFDRSGEIERLLGRMADVAGAQAHAAVPIACDEYRRALDAALEAARRHDQLTLRLHAADSVRALINLLFGLEHRWPPPPERLAHDLEPIEHAQGWPAGYLPWILLHLLRDPAPRRQLELARRVDRLLVSRGLDPILGPEPPAAPMTRQAPAARPAPAARRAVAEGAGA